MNARLVQGIFDDLNPVTRGQWMYPDTRTWDADRNTQEFIDAMAAWREHGLVSLEPLAEARTGGQPVQFPGNGKMHRGGIA